MANKVTIEVEGRFIDNISRPAENASSAITDVGDAAKQAGINLNNFEKGSKKIFGDIGGDADKASQDIEDVGDSAEEAGKDIVNAGKRAEDALDGVGESAQEAQKDINAIGKTKVVPKVDDSRIENAKRKLDDVDRKLSRLQRVTNVLVRVRDSEALSSLRKLTNGAEGLVKKTWHMIVRVKDLALSPLTKIKNALFSIKTLAATVFTGLLMGQVTQKGIMQPIALADAYSSAQIGFSTLMGETGGQQMMDDLDEFAKKTPFKTSNVIANAQKMMAMGWGTDTLLEDMEVIGNAAASTGKLDVGLESIVRALSQIKTKGRLSTEELNQLAEAGISAKAMLAEQLGYGTGDKGIAAMTEDLEKGKIGSEVALEALINGMHKFDGMMDSMANETAEGLMSQLQDVFEINVVRKWGQGLQDGAKKGFGTIIDLLDRSEESLEAFGEMLYDIGKTVSNWAVEKLNGVIDRIAELTSTQDFKNADLGGKIKILWDGLIADPLREWWEGGGRDKAIKTAGEIGEWLGKALSDGIKVLLGVTDIFDEDMSENGAANIAQSFARGFVDNFDVSGITDKLIEAVKNVWNALPTWAKALVIGYGGAKAIGGVSNVVGTGLEIWGNLSKVVGSASKGTGLLGLGSKAAINLGAGNLAGGASLGAGALSAVGLAGIAGGVAGGATLFKSGRDFYNAYKAYDAGDDTEFKANMTSGSLAFAGVGGGAALGAAIGSIVPGLGTAVGALIGAGVGGVAGWLGGNKAAEKIRAEAEAAKFETKELQDMIKDTETTAEEFNQAFSEAVYGTMKRRFGDLKLSFMEIQAIAEDVVWGSTKDIYNNFKNASQQAETSLRSMQTSAEDIRRWEWKAGIGMTFDEKDSAAFAQSVENYIASAQQFVEDKHYEFVAAVSVVIDPESESGKKIIGTGDAVYTKLQNQLDQISAQMSSKLELALQDGVISLDEQKEIDQLQTQVARIIERVSTAEHEAKMDLIKLKFGDGNIDGESFQKLMEETTLALEERMAANDEAFITAKTGLKLQLDEGAISQEQYDARVKELCEGYQTTVDEIKADVLSLELEIIGDAFPELSEDAKKSLEDNLMKSLEFDIHPRDWTTEQTRAMLGISDLSEEGAALLREFLGGITDQLGLMEVDASIKANLTAEPAEEVTPATFGIPSWLDQMVTTELAAFIKQPVDQVVITPTTFGIPTRLEQRIAIDVIAEPGNATGFTWQDPHEFRGGIVGGSSALEQFATGGMVRGGARLAVVAEEGSPEMIIPLSSQRRERGLKLWEKAGQMLGVPGFARGGITGGNADEGIRFRSYGSQEAAGGTSVTVDVGGVDVSIHVDATGQEGIVEAIRSQSSEIAETVAGIFAEAFSAQFENTPVRGGA